MTFEINTATTEDYRKGGDVGVVNINDKINGKTSLVLSLDEIVQLEDKLLEVKKKLNKIKHPINNAEISFCGAIESLTVRLAIRRDNKASYCFSFLDIFHDRFVYDYFSQEDFLGVIDYLVLVLNTDMTPNSGLISQKFSNSFRVTVTKSFDNEKYEFVFESSYENKYDTLSISHSKVLELVEMLRKFS